jgi:hypothetical protein
MKTVKARVLAMLIALLAITLLTQATDSFVRVPPDSTGKKVDHEQYTVNSDTVQRQRVQADYVVVVNATVTRPSDTTAYAAGDAVTNSTSGPVMIDFSGVTRDGAKAGTIVNAILIDSANQATKGVFELWLFDRENVTPDNDNSPFTPTDAELGWLIGVIEFTIASVGDATAGAGGNVIFTPTAAASAPGFKSIHFTTRQGGVPHKIYGELVVRNAYTPVSAEQFTIRLAIRQE